MIYRQKSVAFATTVEGDWATAWSFLVGVLFLFRDLAARAQLWFVD